MDTSTTKGSSMTATYKDAYEWCLREDEAFTAIFLVSYDDIEELTKESVELDPPRKRLFEYLKSNKTPKTTEDILRITVHRLIGRCAAVSSALYNFDPVQEI